MLALIVVRLRGLARALRPRRTRTSGRVESAAGDRPLPHRGGCSATSPSRWSAGARRAGRPVSASASATGSRPATPARCAATGGHGAVRRAGAGLARRGPAAVRLSPRAGAARVAGARASRRGAACSASCSGCRSGQDLSPFAHTAAGARPRTSGGRRSSSLARPGHGRSARPRVAAFTRRDVEVALASVRHVAARAGVATAAGRHRHRPPSASGAPSLGGRAGRRQAARARPSRTTRRACATPGTSPTGGAPPTSRSPASCAATPGLREAPAVRGRGGRRGHHAGARAVGRGRRQQRPVRRPLPGPLRRRRPRASARGWPATSCATGCARVERRGGWPTLARTHGRGRRRPPVAPPRGAGWTRCDALPQVAQHGDPVPANLPGPRRATTWSPIDWAHARARPGRRRPRLLSLAAREELEPLLDAYLLGLPDGPGDPRSRWRSGPG